MTALPVRLQRQAAACGWQTRCFRSDSGVADQFDLSAPPQSAKWELVAVRPMIRLELFFEFHQNQKWTIEWAVIRRKPKCCKSEEWGAFILTDCVAPLAHLEDYCAVRTAIWAQDDALRYVQLPDDPAQCLGARECHRISVQPQQ